MNTLPVRLSPGDDLRRALEAQAPALGGSAMVVAGIGSLTDARLRFAGAESLVTLPGLFEIISLSGTLSRDGAHLHMSVAGADGRVFGGHVPYGNTVRTTAEVLLVTDATLATCGYGLPFTAIVGRDNFFGAQFHPERSGPAGARLLQNFLEL